MVKKKKAKKKVATKKSTSKTTKKRSTSKRSSTHKIKAVNKEPEYTVQISDPKMLRKDILESLREVIIFMQGYDKFRKIQEEKVILFNRLKLEVKELNSLNHKLSKHLPKGKLAPVKEKVLFNEITIKKEEEKAILEDLPKPPKVEDEGLDVLESQLSEIEEQLDKI